MINRVVKIADVAIKNNFGFMLIKASVTSMTLSILTAIVMLSWNLSFCNSCMVFLVTIAFAIAIVIARVLTIYFGICGFRDFITKPRFG